MSSLFINANGPSLLAQRNFAAASAAASASLERMATGSRINRAADDPAGMISSEQLSAALAALDAETRGAARTEAVANVADAALLEISGLLSDANAAEVANANTAGISQEERDANQMMIDSALQSANRLTAATFNGKPVLDGSMTLTIGGASLNIPRLTMGDLGAATAQVSTLRGQIGAFQHDTVEPMLRSNAEAFENTAAARSMVRDTNYAAEAAIHARAQALQAGSLWVLNFTNRSANHSMR